MDWKPTPEQMRIMNEDAYLVDSGILDQAIQGAKQEWYGIVRCNPEDVIAAAENNGIKSKFDKEAEQK